jgi:hypothetical protein
MYSEIEKKKITNPFLKKWDVLDRNTQLKN